MREIYLDILPKYKKGSCKGKINWKESIGLKVKFRYKDIQGELEIINYTTNDGYLYIKYKENKFLKIKSGDFRKCKIGKILGKVTKDFKIEIGQKIVDSKRNLVIIDRKYKRDEYGCDRKLYKYKCNICTYEKGWINERDIIAGNGCSCCNGKAVVEGINDIPTTAPFMIKYFEGGYDEAKLYNKSSNKCIYPICPDCGSIRDKPIKINTIYNTHSIGCKKCSDGISYPNKLMYNILDELNIEFISEYSPDWVKPRRYDFYFKLNDKEYIIEMDGIFHNKTNTINGQTKEQTKEIDAYKDKLAKEHNIEVIRIDCSLSELKYIKSNILNTKLSELINNIDWDKIENLSLSSLCKKACDIKKNNPTLTTVDIGKLMKLDRHTIATYLKRGDKLNWCKYDVKEEFKIRSAKSHRTIRNR